MGRIEDKKRNRLNRRRRIRSKIHGTAERPRLSIFRSTRHIYAQIIDDDMGAVITSASTMEAQLRGSGKNGGNIDAAREVGKLLAERRAGHEREHCCGDIQTTGTSHVRPPLLIL